MSSIMTQKNGEVIVVYFTEARILDDMLIDRISKELAAVVDRCEYGKLLLNFQDVRFLGSAMLGKLILLNKKCKEAKVTLKLSDISDDIMQVFKIMKLDKVLDIHKSEEKALKKFDKERWFG